MRTRALFLQLASLAASFAVLGLGSPACLGQQPRPAGSDMLEKFLRHHLGQPHDDVDRAVRYVAGFADLRDDGEKDAIVYLLGRAWCGSGGCTALVLAPTANSYRVITTISITRPPIRVLVAKSNGWHDLAVRVQAGGIETAYEAELPFDGKSYARNPSMPPARRAKRHAEGAVVVPADADGLPLYP